MLQVLIIDDAAEVRTKVLRCLARADVQLSSAANGLQGLEQARATKPDLIICDIDMPEMNGFEVLEALRADEELASVQIMLLTGYSSRDSMRLGMTLGADDYLTKPFTDEELISAFNGLLKKRGRIELLLDHAAKNREEFLRRMFAHTFSADERSQRPVFDQSWKATLATSLVIDHGAVLHANIRGFTSIAEKLTAQEVETLLCAYFERACMRVRIHGGRYLQMLGDSLIAVFVEDAAIPALPASQALRAALAVNAIAVQFGAWLNEHFPDRGLPIFSVGCGVSYGPVSIAHAEDEALGGGVPVGTMVRLAGWLESAGESHGWSVCTTVEAAVQVGSEMQVGNAEPFAWPKEALQLEVVEVRYVEAMATIKIRSEIPEKYNDPDALAHKKTAFQAGMQTAVMLQSEVKENAHAAARAVKCALDDRLVSIKNHRFDENSAPPQLAGFQLVRRLGSGGMSSIYLGKRQSDGDLFVLKVIDSGPAVSAQMARFVREYALVQAIRHPNIIRIYNQGFSDAHAYIAMEYFENGDLRQRLGKPFTHANVLLMAMQIASALSVIHALGIVHRDLKPENLMVRADGSVVLADFGIAKAITTSKHHELEVTQVGQILGTPSYISPEQIAAIEVMPQSDLYSLGVILFEILTGERPYQANNLLSLLQLHSNAPTPLLPTSCAAFQPVIDRLMSKQPSQRYASSDALLEDLALLNV